MAPCHATYTPLLFADLFNLLNPFAYSRCNFPPRLHLNNTNPVYICQLWDDPIFMNIIEHIPAVWRWCQGGRKNKESHLEAHFSQPRLFSSETRASQFDVSLHRPHSCLFWHFVVFNVFSLSSFTCPSPTEVNNLFLHAFEFEVWRCLLLNKFHCLVSRVPQHRSIVSLPVSFSFFYVSGSDPQSNEPISILHPHLLRQSHQCD